MCISKNFSNISTETSKSAFVHQIEFDKARWSCSWNSDQTYNKAVLAGRGGDEALVACWTQGGEGSNDIHVKMTLYNIITWN